MPLVVFLIILIFPLSSCQDNNPPVRLLIQSSLNSLQREDFHVNIERVERHISNLANADTVGLLPRRFITNYYKSNKPFLWVGYNKLSPQVDSLLDFLNSVDTLGLSTAPYRIEQIGKDIETIKDMAFNANNNSIDIVVARLEYNLTRALLIYCRGQRFGFTNPNSILNHIQVKDSDSLHISYKQLYDPCKHVPNDSFYTYSLSAAANQHLIEYLKSLQPANALYQHLKASLKTAKTQSERQLIALNMEKCRWLPQSFWQSLPKRIIVNIPSQHLYAYDVDVDTIMIMRVGYGSKITKTPLLHSNIYRMDVNPQWILPQSIVDSDVAHHAGNAEYFKRRGYFVCKPSDFKPVNLYSVSPSMLYNRRYIVVQRGGSGNALGRIIFRFSNNFSVFLHDTPHRSAFMSSQRSISHGCIRLQHPYKLCDFLLGGNKNKERLLERIHYSMSADINIIESDSNSLGLSVDKDKLIKTINVVPNVPLAITYFTLFPNSANVMTSYPDVYNYDDRILYSLLPYISV